jgi:hypothetical protein
VEPRQSGEVGAKLPRDCVDAGFRGSARAANATTLYQTYNNLLQTKPTRKNGLKNMTIVVLNNKQSCFEQQITDLVVKLF